MAQSPYATAAQTGESYTLRAPQDAQNYLSGAEVANYANDVKGLTAPAQMKKGKIRKADIANRNALADQVSRLRDVASSRALGQYQQDATQMSKPWKAQPNTLISDLTVADPTATGGSRDFSAKSYDAGVAMKGTLQSMAGSGGAPTLLDPNLLGDAKTRAAQRTGIAMMSTGSRPMGGLSRDVGMRRQWNAIRQARLSKVKFSSNVTNAERAYLGTGGLDTGH